MKHFKVYADDLARAGLLSISFDHVTLGKFTANEETSALGCSITITDDITLERSSVLLMLQPVPNKTDVTTAEFIVDFLTTLGLDKDCFITYNHCNINYVAT